MSMNLGGPRILCTQCTSRMAEDELSANKWVLELFMQIAPAGQLKLKWAQAGRILGSLCKSPPGRIAETEVGTNRTS